MRITIKIQKTTIFKAYFPQSVKTLQINSDPTFSSEVTQLNAGLLSFGEGFCEGKEITPLNTE